MADIDYERVEIPADHYLQKECPGLQAYQKGPVKLFFVPRERTKTYAEQRTEFSAHLSISCEDRYPTWDEIKEARYRFMPRDRDVFMILPAEEDYVNIHPNCFHLWMPLIEGDL